jgi:thioredoxin reductase
MNADPDVLIVGAGPAGLAAAHSLKRHGVENVLVVEREPEAGGIPRFCPHPTFGLPDFFRPMSGPAYAAKWRSLVDPGWISGATTVTAIGPGLETTISTADGLSMVRPKRLLLATGIRETPRSARLVSGDRPRNVLTTGAVQRLLAETHRLPFVRPLVVGTELVSFSALLSLREAGVRAVAMIEAGDRIVTRRPADVLAGLILKTPIRYLSRVERINAATEDASRLASVTIEDNRGVKTEIACDAVIFTGAFVPEASLLGGLLTLCNTRSRGPAIDQSWRLGQAGLYAAGNVLRSVETAAWAAREGTLAGDAIAADHFGKTLPSERRVAIIADDPVAFSTPSFFAVPGPPLGPLQLSIRMARAARGTVTLSADARTFWRSPGMTALPERRIVLRPSFPDLANVQDIRIGFETDGRA